MSNKVSFIYIAQDRYTKIANKIAKVTNKVRNNVIKTKPAFDKLTNAIKKSGNSLLKFGKRAKSAGIKLSVFATLPVLALGASFIKAASDSEETRSKFATIFKSISKKAEKTATDLAKNFGLSGTAARKLLGDTGDLLTGFGFTQDTALNLGKQVNELAVDLASFTNFSGGAEGASAALTKALLGERESVKSLGISILDEDVKKKVQILLAQGMRFATLRQAKAFATLKIAQEQSKNAIGDYNRTAKSFANRMRLMSARTQDLKEKLGNILLPIAVKLVNVLISLVEKFTKLSPTMQKVILIIISIVAVLGPLLLIIGAIITIMPALISVMAALGTAFIFMTGPIGLVILGISALIVILFTLRKKWIPIFESIGASIFKFQKKWNEVFESIGAKAAIIVNKFNDIKERLFSSITAIISKISSIKEFFGFDAIDLNIKKTTENIQNSNIDKRAKSLITSNQQSRTDINVSLKAPQNAVESIKTKTTGIFSGLNVGVNMATTQ